MKKLEVLLLRRKKKFKKELKKLKNWLWLKKKLKKRNKDINKVYKL